MNTKERVRNDILVAMRMYLDTCTMMVLDAVLVKAIQNVEMTETTTLPATLDYTNQYIRLADLIQWLVDQSDKFV